MTRSRKALSVLHYRRAVLAMITAFIVVLIGFGSGWYVAQRNADKADAAQQNASEAQQDAKQATTNEEAAKAYLRSACDQGLRSACHQLANINRIPVPPTPSPVTQSEIQEPEVQDPEIQDPDTFCSDHLTRCQGEKGPKGPSGSPGPEGLTGRGLSSMSCDEAGHFVATYTDGVSEELPSSQCVGKEGPKGQSAPAITQVEVSRNGSLSFSFSDGTALVFSICPPGSSYQRITTLTTNAVPETFYACVVG